MGNRVSRQRVVGDSDGKLGDDVGGCGRDEQKIGPFGELDVIDAAFFGIAPLVGDDPVTGDCGQRERRDESRGVGRDDHPDVGAGVTKTAYEIGRLVRRDPAGHA